MAVYYKFKSAKEYDSVVIDGHFISVGQLKEKIFELKHLGRGTDFDLVVTNAQTNEEYLDEGALIPKNTSVLIRRVPGCPRKPIVTAPVTELEEPIVENNIGDVQPSKDTFAGTESSTAKYADDVDWDEFGNDLYAIPESVPVRSSIPVQDAAPVNKENEDEDSMIKALIDTPALDWQSQPSNGFGSGRGFGRGMGGRMMGGRGFGRGGFESRNPPPGYICHRCKVPGHFIHHCPTNGDPTFDLRRVKPPTGIPRSMLMATPDGSYALPSGAVAVLKPNEAAFEREIEGMPSTRSVGELPPELHCPVCKEVMKDAVLTSKCCFTSFCDKCIRDYIISKSMCVCGATNVLADDLLPNKTLRDTINRILESNDSSAEKGGSAFQVQDMESRIPQAKAPSPTQSAASKGHQMSAQPVQREEYSKISEGVEENVATNARQKQENGTTPKVPDVLEATHEVKSFREAASQGSAQLVDEEVQQKPISGEEGKKKKKKKIRMPPGAAEMQWRPGQDLAPENYMMPPPPGPSAFNPYWNGMPPGLESGFMPPYPGPMPYMGGYGFGGPMDVPFGGFMPLQDPFGGMGGMMPYGPPPPHRDLAELAMGFNPGPPNMSREEFEAREAHKMKRRCEMERRGEREMSRDHQDYGREANLRKEISKDRNYKDRDYYGREQISKVNVPPMKSKSKSTLPSNAAEHHQQPPRPDHRIRDPELPRPSSKRKSADYDHSSEEELRHQRRRVYSDEDNHHRRRRSSQKRRSESPSETLAAADKKQKASVFSRISFPGKDSAPKSKRLSSSSGSAGNRVDGSNGYYEEEQKVVKRSSVSVDYESSDDERHFKRRRPSKHTSSSPPPQVEDHSRGHSKRRYD